MNDVDIALSRPAAAAEGLDRYADHAHNYIDRRLLITGESAVLESLNGRVVSITALLLAVRTVRSVELYLPAASSLIEELKTIAAEVALENQPPRFLIGPAELRHYDAVLNIGFHADQSLGVTAVVSNGWIAHVSSIRPIVASFPLVPNAVGAIAGTCLGFSDIFKRLIGIREERASYFDRLAFSTYSNTVTSTNDGPELPATIDLPRTLVAGCGAIGNGIALTIALLPAEGDMSTLDKQSYGIENYGTSVLLGPAGFRERKAAVLAGAMKRLNPKLNVTPIPRPIERFKTDDPTVRPTLVLAGFDKISPRHALQNVPTDVVIDGGIDEFGVQVSSWRRGGPAGCLRCQFIEAPEEDPWQCASRLTGLSASRTLDADDVVNDADIDAAPEAMKSTLRGYVGRKICSVISEKTTQEIAANAPHGFAPSVPWVAVLCGALVVGQALRATVFEPGYCPSRVSFDVLIGPTSVAEWDEHPRASCACAQG